MVVGDELLGHWRWLATLFEELFVDRAAVVAQFL